ncbi:MAG: Coenzyme F420 hydrogenase/dehydrogenase, beta subunit C-terminal domain [Clostridia bacterium]|nr:Coenzyme F420 hydrogenase/dehydrogenase, beta subunit C-terminal domain [Clostridia bacterium]
MCADVCPKQCISIKYDAHGFYKSYIDDSLCINCHRCKDVCPANYPNKPHGIQKAYKARRTDKEAAIQSTSGGIASVLSEYVIKNGGTVAGCGFDDTFCLKHSLASELEELNGFKGSKYLQSYTVGVYRHVREQLQANKPVLFIGTPCQVSALQNYLGKEYDKLYLVDFVCHGVSSRYVFDKYIDSLNQTTLPISIRFRNKSQGYRNKKACFEIQVEYPDKTVRNTTDSGVYYWFATSLSVRESCYKCPFTSRKRPSDITLADYIGKDLDDTDNEIGVNTVFVNSEKGNALIEAIKRDIVMEQKDTNHTVKLYDHLMMSSRKPSCRKSFFNELPVCDYETLVRKYDAEKVLPSKMVRRYYAMKRRLRKLFAK